MREIKFRAWDAEEKNFVYFDALDGILSKCDETYRQRCVGKFEQYTGLHDKNDKEIYEGDVVKIITKNEDLNHWMETGETFVVKYEEYGFNPFTEYDSDCGEYLRPEWCEVIGNIHENPELLEGRE